MKYFFLVLITLSTLGSVAQKGGWTSLFDGKTLKGWKSVAGSAPYKVEDGSITGYTVHKSGNTFLITENEYDDFILELEVKLQDSTLNSGVQFRSTYDNTANNGVGKVFGYQFELDPSGRKWFGGIYDESRRGWLYPLSLHPQGGDAYKKGEFNKIRIECIGNIIRTWVNGKPVAYLVDSLTRKGVIALQVHSINDSATAGKKIQWKNIRLRKGASQLQPFPENIYVVNLLPNTLDEQEKKQGWQLLFDGTTSNGWKGAYKPAFPEKGWQIADGKLTVLASNGDESTNGGDIVTTEKYSAFDLSFEFNITPGANSGVKYFVTLKENNPGSAIGLEYQVLDDKVHPDAKLGKPGTRTLSSLYDLIPAKKENRFVMPPGQWNRGRIVVRRDNHVEHYLNGIKVLEYERGSEQFRALVAESKYKIWPNFGEAPEGHILLQDHGNEVGFRSIKLRKL
jgi:hypothetical protein